MVQNVANVATGTTIVSGAATGTHRLVVESPNTYGFIAENATVFGVFLTTAMFAVAVLFHILNYRISRQRLFIAIEDSERGIKQNISDDELKMLKQWCDRRR